MIADLPVAALAPLDYRAALDAAMPLLAPSAGVICNRPELVGEVRQRLPHWQRGPVAAALWVEPLTATWQADLALLTATLSRQARLVVVASRPLALLLPECRGWPQTGLGATCGGLRRLRAGLRRAGLRTEASYGFHTLQSMVLNLLSARADRLGRPDLADRLHFAARLAYCARGPLAAGATVALLVVRKGAS